MTPTLRPTSAPNASASPGGSSTPRIRSLYPGSIRPLAISSVTPTAAETATSSFSSGSASNRQISPPVDDKYDLDRALGMLGPKDREALQLTYWEGLSAMQVAEVLQCTEQAAWKRISRARTQLRQFLDGQDETLGQEDAHV